MKEINGLIAINRRMVDKPERRLKACQNWLTKVFKDHFKNVVGSTCATLRYPKYVWSCCDL